MRGGIQAALVPLSGPDPTSPAPARLEVAEIQGLLESWTELVSRREGFGGLSFCVPPLGRRLVAHGGF